MIMITVEQVKTKKQQREFLNFQLKLYKGNPYYAPPLYMDEKKIFSKNFVYNDICESVYFNAYKDGVMAGRISGIIQKSANQKYNQKRVRLSKFDVIEDEEVARALFKTLEDWTLQHGMEEVVGPLGYSDLEREGLLIGGFDQPATFEENYNYPYYQTFLENYGYQKEVDWSGSNIRVPKDYDGEMHRLAEFVLKRYNLHIGKSKNTRDFLKKYSDGIFELLDKSYDMLYGTVPFTEGMKKMMIENFKLVIRVENAAVILDENDKMVCFGLAFPGIADAVRKTSGHLTPGALIRVLKTMRKPRVLDLCLVGVDPVWFNRGVSVVVCMGLIDMLKRKDIEYADTNLNLEDNYPILNLWKRFDSQVVKHYRCFVKKLV